MKKLFPLFALAISIAIVGCGGSKQKGLVTENTEKTMDDIPGWVLNPPKSDENYLFAAGTGVSRDLALARDKASEDARMQIAKSIESRFESISKRFQEEVGTDLNAQYLDQFTQASKTVVSQVLTGVSIDKVEMKNEGGMFRAYVLMKMPIGSTSQALLDKLKQQEQLYTRFRSTQVFDELNQEADKFQNWKDNGGEMKP